MLMQEWEKIVTRYSKDAASQQKFWTNYYLKEKEVYEQILSGPIEVITGTVKELADKYGMEPAIMLGFLDGIIESIKEPNSIEDLEEDTTVTLDIEPGASL